MAKADPDEAGWYQPQEGPRHGPWAFDVARDGSILRRREWLGAGDGPAGRCRLPGSAG